MMDEARENAVFDVFLSHNSKDKQAVRALAALLTERGVGVWLDEDQLVPGRPWQPLLEKGIKDSATGAVLVGVDGLGPWEDEEMRALLDLAVREKKPVVPVLLPGAPQKPELPLFLSNRTWVDLREGFKEDNLAKLIWGITGRKPDSPSSIHRAHRLEIAVTRLRHGADTLVGRERELARLDATWHDPKTHVVTIVAWGGVGKTALMVEWMARMAKDDWRGAERVFDWSFYSQGTREQGSASADTFIAAALEFFGGEDGKRLAASPTSPWDKGAKLAQLVAKHRTLLVLDGLEPLQYPPGPVGGKLKDPALEALLKGLTQRNVGLCLVTTREPVTDLAPFRNTTAPEWPLEHLSEEAGAYLLFNEGVRRAGNAEIEAGDSELKAAAREVSGHALTLQLLGRYLAKVHDGDIRKRSLVAFRKADAKVQGGHAFRTMAAYEKWLGKAGEEGQRQLAILHLLGLFDRPADAGCITALRQEPAIERLTEALIGLENDDWNCTLSNLHECGLIGVHIDESAVASPQLTIDCHPLVREYFARQLREKRPKAWREAHRRIYRHLTENTDYRPNTLAGLQPLYQAVVHGCQAGMPEDACVHVYHGRILRGVSGPDAFYSTLKLGAISSDLAAVACFFDQPWTIVSESLMEGAQAWLLNEAAFSLRALGRSAEALEPMQAAVDTAVRMEIWKNAAVYANNLSELELTLGEVIAAIHVAELSMAYANRSHDAFHQLIALVAYADALHQAGRWPEAQACFRKAEQVQKDTQRRYPLLYSIGGFRYCDLLLTGVERAAWRHCLQLGTENGELQTAFEVCRAVSKRVSKTRKWEEGMRGAPLLDFALHDLALGRIQLFRTSLRKSRIRSMKSKTEEAVAGLRVAGHMDDLPRGLLTRAWLRFLAGARTGPESAQADLDQAWEIAERGPMRLFLADIHLYRARLFGMRSAEWGVRNEAQKYPWESPQADLAAARKLINECGYHRRDEELADAEEAAKTWGTG